MSPADVLAVAPEDGCCPAVWGPGAAGSPRDDTSPLSIISSCRGSKADDPAAATLRPPAAPSEGSSKGPPEPGGTSARPSKCWALGQNAAAAASSPPQPHPQDRTFSSLSSFQRRGVEWEGVTHTFPPVGSLLLTKKLAFREESPDRGEYRSVTG